MTSSGTRVVGPSVAVLQGIGKRYGSRLVIEEVDLVVGTGEVVGLVGPNGAGKTTLLGIVGGLTQPTSGTGSVLGQEIGPRKRPRPFVGVMTEHPGFVEHLSGRRNLVLLARLRGVVGISDIERALAQVHLDGRDRRPVSTYSQGMRQRLALAQAIMEKPHLLILDEPTNGLDPAGIIEIRRMIRATASEGAGVLLASHLLGEVQAVCDTVLLVDGGRVSPLVARVSHEGRGRLIAVDVGADDQGVLVARIPGATIDSSPSPRTMIVRWQHTVPEFVRALVGAGVDVERVAVVTDSLEDLYLQQAGVGEP